MSKMIKLWISATVCGRTRHPNEGVLHLEDDEAKRLIESGAAEDVTSDFTAAQMKAQPVESLTTEAGHPATAAPASFDPAAEERRIIAERQAAAAPPPPPLPDPLQPAAEGGKGGAKK